MNQPLKGVRKITREFARREGLQYYNNGVPCDKGHTPIIRMVSTGTCYHCAKERAALAKAIADEKAKYPSKYYVRFKKKDGTFEIIGPFARRKSAVAQYRRRHLQEYGVPLPANYFGPASDVEDSEMDE